MSPTQPPKNEFSKQADEQSPSLLAEVVDLLKHNRKWWLIPVILALALVGLLVMLSGSVVAPFIYPLF